MAGNIFINYRRDDDAGFTQALYSRLEQAFPSESLFMDVDNIAPGLDFVQVLNEEVARCDVVIAVIGKNWLSAADETGERRLDNREDFVRIEIESALAQKKRVIPVLVNDAKMPHSTELPDSLKPFARCNAVRLTHERFRADTAGLIKSLESVLAEAEAARIAEAKAKKERRKTESQSARTRSIRQEVEHQVKAETEPAILPEARDKRREPSSGIVGWIAGLPSEVSWAIPLVVMAVLFLGWLLPWPIFRAQLDLGQGLWPLLYAISGLLAGGFAVYVRRKAVGGAELAVYWFATISLLGIGVVSVLTWLGLGYSIETSLFRAAIAIFTAAVLIAIRRSQVGGLEFAVYWLGVAIVLFWAIAPLVINLGMGFALGTYFSDGASWYRSVVVALAAAVIISALITLLWRRSRLNGPEIAVYLIGIAYALYVALEHAQALLSA
jgi:hypothetical protein